MELNLLIMKIARMMKTVIWIVALELRELIQSQIRIELAQGRVEH